MRSIRIDSDKWTLPTPYLLDHPCHPLHFIGITQKPPSEPHGEEAIPKYELGKKKDSTLRKPSLYDSSKALK